MKVFPRSEQKLEQHQQHHRKRERSGPVNASNAVAITQPAVVRTSKVFFLRHAGRRRLQ